jgi:hypothetical protein
LVFTESQPKNDAKFFISGSWWMGGGGGALFLFDISGKCIIEAPSLQALFCFQFNSALTDVNYLQLFSAGRRIF